MRLPHLAPAYGPAWRAEREALNSLGSNMPHTSASHQVEARCKVHGRPEAGASSVRLESLNFINGLRAEAVSQETSRNASDRQARQFGLDRLKLLL
jgi:hypothetical protein